MKIEGTLNKGFFQSSVGEKGIYDGDTLYGVEVDIPGNLNKLPPFDEVDPFYYDDEGKKHITAEAWKNKELTVRDDGGLYLKGTTIRIAGFDAFELKTKEGRAAREALYQLFKTGWVDPKFKNRFKFLVRAAGNVRNHSREPYTDKFDRIVTDVYIIQNGKETKFGEVVLYNAADKLKQGGHGVEWFPR